MHIIINFNQGSAKFKTFILDEKVIKVMLPMVAIAVLACVVGYYVKNKFFKDDEDKEEKEKSEQKKIEGQKFPNQPKANKPWLTAQGTLLLFSSNHI